MTLSECKNCRKFEAALAKTEAMYIDERRRSVDAEFEADEDRRKFEGLIRIISAALAQC